MSEPKIPLNCPNHGSVEWQGDVFCKKCNAFYLCSGVEDGEGFTATGEKRSKYVYPDAPPNGMCTCGKRLFGGMDFTARPMCHECAVTVMRRKAELEGKLFWIKSQGGVGEFKNEECADPKGDGSFMLSVFENENNKSIHVWEVIFPSGVCSGHVHSREEARAMAEKIYRAVAPAKKE